MDDVKTPSSRRHFFQKAIAISSVIPLAPQLTLGLGTASLPAAAAYASDAALPSTAPSGYASLGADEAAVVEALVNLMCPADALSPGGVDAGLATFIDRQLAGAYGAGDGRYQAGPWASGKPQQGSQLPLSPQEHFKLGLAALNRVCQQRHATSFDLLQPAEAEAVLSDVAAGKARDASVALQMWFEEQLYPLFTQACFADPLYGGNHDKVFWKMIGYPGLPATHARDVVAFRGKPYPDAAMPKSILDFS
jgi:gluconate 2-dehydrogenase gamma chain